MRQDTRTFQAVLGGPAINVDPDLASSRPSVKDVSVCARCSDTIFSPLTWAHLRGDTLDPPIPAKDGDKSDYHIMNDLDFVVQMFNAGESPKVRGPMVDFKIPVKEILESSQASCGFCKILVLLDTEGSLLAKDDTAEVDTAEVDTAEVDTAEDDTVEDDKAEGDKKVVLRLQAFWPETVSMSMYPMVLEIGLHADISGGGKVWPLTFFNESVPILDSPGKAESLNIYDTWTPLLQQAAEWLWNCQRTHDECSHIEDQRPPTRVLDLNHFWDQGEVRLVESTGVANGQYAVLSYVWGASNTVRLDETTHSKFTEGLDVEKLPRTIREAILVTNKLGIRYLWIDSLCIFQDSDIDKSHEIPRMNEYYRNALVVISASGGKDVQSGFLFYQETSHEVYAKLQNLRSTRKGIIGSVPLRIPGHFPDYSTSLLVDIVPIMYRYKREPINNRAWTLQESVLPRRLLTFPMTGGLLMRCLKDEEFVGEIVSDPYHGIPSSNSLGTVSSGGRTGDELHDLWTRMIEDYTQRALTHRSDILIAIGALAREFHTKNGDLLGSYLGGLWRNHLRSGLLWRNLQSCPEPQHELVPSWSWASCIGPIAFRNEPEMYLPLGPAANTPLEKIMYTTRWYCEVVSCEVTPRSHLDAFGALSGGALTIRGPLRPLQQHTDRYSGHQGTTTQSLGCPDLYLDEANGAAGILLLDRPLSSSKPGKGSNTRPQYHWFGLWYAGRGRARGLIVQQTKEGSFQRLGFAEYPVSEATFPSSELHKERVIRLV